MRHTLPILEKLDSNFPSYYFRNVSILLLLYKTGNNSNWKKIESNKIKLWLNLLELEQNRNEFNDPVKIKAYIIH